VVGFVEGELGGVGGVHCWGGSYRVVGVGLRVRSGGFGGFGVGCEWRGGGCDKDFSGRYGLCVLSTVKRLLH